VSERDSDAARQQWLKAWRWALLGLYAALAFGITVLLRGIRFDDPYITYRFAENLAAGQGFVFNSSDSASALITTTPLYALLLAACRLVGFDIPTASHWLGGVGLGMAACGLFLLNSQRQSLFHFRAGALAGVNLLLFSLLWLTVGFETPVFIAVALWAFVCVMRDWRMGAGLLCGTALGLRGDGAIVLGVVLMAALLRDTRSILQRWRAAMPILIGAAVIYVPLAIWLTLQFGSPIPSTLQTKSAQAVAGLTGFYTGTSYLEGAWILIQAYVRQGGLFLVTLAVMLVGAVAMVGAGLAPVRMFAAKREADMGSGAGASPAPTRTNIGMWLPVAWMGLHFVGYGVIGVAPYVWYYAPMIPGVCVLLGLGLAELWQRMRGVSGAMQRRVGTLWLGVLGGAVLLSLLIGDALLLSVIRGGTPPNPTQYESKLLPETKVDVYERVGRWIAANTPTTATLGVTELGVMSYYAQRHTVDFLGLTQPQHIADIRHGDFLAGLLREQPDYVALSAINAIYDVNPQRDAWFTQMYTQVATFADERFWGGPMTVWRRTRAPITTTETLFQGAADLGEGWQILQTTSNTRLANASGAIFLRLQLKAGNATGAHTLRVQPVVLEGGDGLPVSSRIVFTNRWRAGEINWVDVVMTPSSTQRVGAYVIEASWIEGGPKARVGMLKIPTHPNDLPRGSAPMMLNQASQLTVEVSEAEAVCRGETHNVRLIWHGGNPIGRDYTVFLHLRDTGNNPVAQGDGPPHNVDALYPTSIWGDESILDTHALNIPNTLAPGHYDLVVGLYDPTTNERFAVDDAPYRTPDGGVRLGQLVVKSC